MPDTEYQYEEFLIRFGRYIGDPLLYLDLAKDPDVDLKITNDFSSTYYVSTELKYTLHEIFLPPETPPEKGYVRSYEHSYWPAVSGSTKAKKLEPGFKVFKVLLRGEPDIVSASGDDSTDAYQLLREISIDFKNKTEVIMDSMEVRDLMFLLSHLYGGPWVNRGEGYIAGSGYYIETYLGYRIGGQVLGDENVGASDYFGHYVDAVASHMGVWAVGADRFSWHAMGVLPYDAIILPFDRGFPGVPLLDTEDKKPVYIRVHTQDSEGDIYINVKKLGKMG